MVTVLPTPVGLRDLSSLANVSYGQSDLGTPYSYINLNTVFTDSPDSYTVSSSDYSVFSVFENFGYLDITPQGFGDAKMTISAHYGAYSIEVKRNVNVAAPAATAIVLDQLTHAGYPLTVPVQSYVYADLSPFTADGATSINVSSLDPAVFTVSMSNGLVSITPVSIGAASIQIDVEYNGFHIVQYHYDIYVRDELGSLIAEYRLNGNSLDEEGSYDAIVASGNVEWVEGPSRYYGQFDEFALLRAPIDVSNNLFQIDQTLEIDFSFNAIFPFGSGEEKGDRVLFAFKESNVLDRGTAGLMLLAVKNSNGPVEIFLNYTDGNDPEQYEMIHVGSCLYNEWYESKLIVDFENENWSVQVGDQYRYGKIEK